MRDSQNGEMEPAWSFPPHDPRNKIREAVQAEFFNSSTEVEALVRESIQNTLDARRKQENAVVKIFVSEESSALKWTQVAPFIDSGVSHFTAAHNGLVKKFDKRNLCRFLTFEDFGTTGLTGEVAQLHPLEHVDNRFFYFFRAEGQQSKSDTELGRWGLGKYTFNMASEIRSLFAYTVRYDDKARLLVGQTILKSHHVGNIYYTPDGWFGSRKENGQGWPVQRQSVIDAFRSLFRIERTSEPGLSVVVPYVEESFSLEQVVEAAASGYFYPILKGTLQLAISNSMKRVVLDAKSLLPISEQLTKSTEIKELIELCVWHLNQDSMHTFRLPDGVLSKYDWDATPLQGELLEKLLEEIENKKRVTIVVPMVVNAKGSTKSTFFTVILEKHTESIRQKPIFIRDGIIISNVKSSKLNGFRAIVIVDDAPLAAMLGDSENPAHTEWKGDSKSFREKYLNGKKQIRFVADCPSNIAQLISEQDRKKDSSILASVFSVIRPTDEMTETEQTDTDKPTKKLGKEKEGVPPIPPAKPKAYTIRRSKGGFVVTNGTANDELKDFSIILRCAYDTSRGNPLRQYSSHDFDFLKPGSSLEVDCQGANVECLGPNELRLGEIEQTFQLRVTGFDPQRDLFVKARVQERKDA